MTFGPKKAGCCLACGVEVYEVREYWGEGLLAGHPRRLGRMQEHGTQVTFLLSDGSEADVTFCIDCALRLEPEDYAAAWEACVERTDLSARVASWSPNQRTAAIAHLMGLWPVAVVRRRREGAEPQTLIMDRR